jgi:hypothetical protein
MKLDLSDAALKRQYNNEEIIKLTAQQVIKDFALFGIDIEFPVDMRFAYFELFEQLHYHISRMWETNNNNLVSLLYRIDLPEKEIWIKKEEHPEQPVTNIITELTLQRELKKVLTRKFYSQPSNSSNNFPLNS